MIFNSMVEYSLDFDAVFGALADGTRRDILTRVLRGDLRVGDLAQWYQLTFAGVAKHIDVLVRAGLVVKRRRGREQWITGNDVAVRRTVELLQTYEALWTERFSRLDQYFAEEELP